VPYQPYQSSPGQVRTEDVSITGSAVEKAPEIEAEQDFARHARDLIVPAAHKQPTSGGEPIIDTQLAKKKARWARWICKCGTSNYSRNTNCHYCRSSRTTSEVKTDISKDSTGDGVNAKHWQHVARRDGTPKIDATGVDNPGDALEQEREKRLRESANGTFVGLAGLSAFAKSSGFKVQVSPQDSERSITRLRRGRINGTNIRKIIQAGATDTKENEGTEVSQLAPDLPQEEHVPPTKKVDKGWKTWQPSKVENNHQESRKSPLIRYNPFDGNVVRFMAPSPSWEEKMSQKEQPSPSREQNIIQEEQPAEVIWKSWSPPSPETAEVVNSRKGYAAARSSKQEIASTYREPSTSSARTRVGDRERSRRRQQRRDEEEDLDEAVLARVERKRQRKKEKSIQSSSKPPTPIILPEFISVGNLATALRVRIEDFVHQMKVLGFEETSNDHILDAETAGLIATEFNFEPVADTNAAEDLVALPPPEDKTYLLQRPPVITIMGHVDHGKTTMLDWLRNSSVAASEHGGITQHIGAFMVPMPSGQVVTFLDTPGHAAFLSMRQRGANVTDIVVLVVAADDSVKPQTIEAINHAKAAGVPMIVAINKIDKPDADVERVKQDLARHGVEVEDFGGDTQTVCVSGKTGQGMQELEDAVVALADILDLRAPTDGQAEGWILEATTRKAGRVATVLVRRGTIAPGSVIVAGTTWARVRSLHDEAGQSLHSAGPGMPVEIDGWREQPVAGDEVLQAPSEHRAKEVVALRIQRLEAERLAKDVAVVNEARRLEQEKEEREAAAAAALAANPDAIIVDTAATETSKLKEIPFIVRGDVSGSVEAVVDSITSLGNTEVRPTILRSAVGPISPTDVEHASAAGGHIISFNTPIDNSIRRMAETAGVSILDHNIIYRLVDDVKERLEDVLPATVTTRVNGEAEVAQVFEINVKGRVTVPVAGCRVRNGVVTKGSKVKILRGGETVYDGKLTSLLHHFIVRLLVVHG
jgi:translation initiation factor IF-2